MATEYWMIKKRLIDVEYYWAGWLGWSNERLRAVRYLTRENALSDLRNVKVAPNTRIVHVRIRRRSERLWMAERLKQWEPLVRASISTVESGIPVVPDDLKEAVRAIAKEHRP